MVVSKNIICLQNHCAACIHHVMERGTKRNQPWVPTMTMGGTVALRSVNNKKFRRATILQLVRIKYYNMTITLFRGV